MRLWLCLTVAVLSACATSEDKDGESSASTDGESWDPQAANGSSTDADADGGADTGSATPEAFIPEDGLYGAIDFRLKEDTCGIDGVVAVTSLMPSNYQLAADEAADRFVMGAPEQGTETGCTVGALDPETGLALFTCDSFREGYRSPYGDGFDMEVSFAGELTEEYVLAGPLTVVLHCMVGDYCEEFANSGVEFPCTIGGDLVLEFSEQ